MQLYRYRDTVARLKSRSWLQDLKTTYLGISLRASKEIRNKRLLSSVKDY